MLEDFFPGPFSTLAPGTSACMHGTDISGNHVSSQSAPGGIFAIVSPNAHFTTRPTRTIRSPNGPRRRGTPPLRGKMAPILVPSHSRQAAPEPRLEARLPPVPPISPWPIFPGALFDLRARHCRVHARNRHFWESCFLTVGSGWHICYCFAQRTHYDNAHTDHSISKWATKTRHTPVAKQNGTHISAKT